jgi:hypothetical protein
MEVTVSPTWIICSGHGHFAHISINGESFVAFVEYRCGNGTEGYIPVILLCTSHNRKPNQQLDTSPRLQTGKNHRISHIAGVSLQSTMSPTTIYETAPSVASVLSGCRRGQVLCVLSQPPQQSTLGLIDERYPHQSTCLIDDPLMTSTPGLIEGLTRVLALSVRGVISKVGGGI